MTSSERAAIRELIVANTIAKQLAVQGNDGAVAAMLNVPSVTVHRQVSPDHILRWAAQTGAVKKLKTEAAIGTNGKQAASEAALLVLQQGGPLHLDAEVTPMLDLLVAGNVLTADDREKLYARAAEQIGVAEQAIGRKITADDVSEALANDRPNGVVGGAIS